MSKPIKIACLGEVMIELIAKDIGRNDLGEERGKASIGVAGDTYNTAVYLSKLNNGLDLEISYVTALGTDKYSERILNEISRHGILTNYIEKRETHMPGLYAIDTDEHGERSFSYWRGQAAARTLFEEPCAIKPEALFGFDLIYISGISIAILPPPTRHKLMAFIANYKQAGGKLVFDSNYRPRLWEDIETARHVTTAMWSLTDIALPSLDDEMALFGDKNEASVLNRLQKAGVTNGALKRGMDGPLPIGESDSIGTYEAVRKVVDTTAAGDSFNAGFLYQYAIGGSLADAMQSGHQLASKVIQVSGAIIEIE